MKTTYGIIGGSKVYHIVVQYDGKGPWYRACHSNHLGRRPMKKGTPPKEWLCKTCLKKLRSLKREGQEINWYGEKPEWA